MAQRTRTPSRPRPSAWPLSLLLAATALSATLVQAAAPGSLYAYDPYFHIRQAWLMRQGLGDPAGWFAFSVFTDHPADMEYGFHWLLMPFTIGDLFLGAKLAVVIGLMGFVAACWWVLVRLQVRAPTLWTAIALVIFPSFFLRLTQLRPALLTASLLLLGLYGLAARRWRLVGAITAVWTWLHVGYPIVLGCVLLYALLQLATRRTVAWPLLGWTAAGWCLGMALHPQPAHYIRILIVQLLRHTQAMQTIGPLPFAQELQPWDAALWRSSAGLLICYAMSTLWLWRGLRERSRADAPNPKLFLWIVLSLAWILAVWRQRFYEYLVPATVLASAVLWDRGLAAARATHRRLWAQWTRRGLITSRRLDWWVGEPSRITMAVVVVALVAQWGWMTAACAQYHVGYSVTEREERQVGQWLARHAEPGAVVANTHWGDFAELFFYDPDSRFLNGFDPIVSYAADPPAFWRWHHLVHDATWCDQPRCSAGAAQPDALDEAAADWLIGRFHADYLAVIGHRPSPAFKRLVAASRRFKPLFQTPLSAVYRVRPASRRMEETTPDTN